MRICRPVHACFRASFALLFAMTIASAHAVEQTPYPPQAPGIRGETITPILRDSIAAPLNEVVMLIGEKDFIGALVKLFDADLVPDKAPYEEYSIAKYLGLIFAN